MNIQATCNTIHILKYSYSCIMLFTILNVSKQHYRKKEKNVRKMKTTENSAVRS